MGLTLSSAGVITGTPTTAGLSTFTVQAEDSETTPEIGNASFETGHQWRKSGHYLTTPPRWPGGPGVSQLHTGGEGRGPSLHLCYRLQQSPACRFDAVQWNDFRYPDNGRKLHRRPVGHRLRKHHSLQTAPLAIAASGASLPNGTYSFEFSGTGPHGAIALNGGFLLQAPIGAWILRREHRRHRISDQSEYWRDHSGARNQRLVATQTYSSPRAAR